jgi:hypothetical protein
VILEVKTKHRTNTHRLLRQLASLVLEERLDDVVHAQMTEIGVGLWIVDRDGQSTWRRESGCQQSNKRKGKGESGGHEPDRIQRRGSVGQ